MALPEDITPGPWHADMMEDDHPSMPPRVYSDQKLVACTGNGEDWTKVGGRWEADAHLIAAAPDMYEALEAILSGPMQFSSDGLVKQSIDALKKARGET